MQPIADLNNMYFFAAVVDAGGFSAAARDLDLQASMLSRRVSALEQELEVRLLNRNSRSISLTEAGKAFYAHSRNVLALLHLLPECTTQAGVVHAVFASRKGMLPAVRTLLDTLAEGFREAQFQ